MKYILPLVIGLMTLSSCDKAILKRTKVQIIYKTPDNEFYFPNDASKHLSGQSGDSVYQMFHQKLVDQFNKGRMDVVNSGADYVVIVKTLYLTENVTPHMDDLGVVHQVSELKVSASYSIGKPYEDDPTFFQTNFTLSESLRQNECKETDKSKDKVYDDDGNKTYDCNKECYYVDKPGMHISGFGGLNAMMEDHAKDIRKQAKDYFKSRQ